MKRRLFIFLIILILVAIVFFFFNKNFFNKTAPDTNIQTQEDIVKDLNDYSIKNPVSEEQKKEILNRTVNYPLVKRPSTN